MSSHPIRHDIKCDDCLQDNHSFYVIKAGRKRIRIIMTRSMMPQSEGNSDWIEPAQRGAIPRSSL